MDGNNVNFVHFSEHSDSLTQVYKFISDQEADNVLLLGGQIGIGKSTILSHAFSLQSDLFDILSLEIDKVSPQIYNLSFLADQLIYLLTKEEERFGFKWKKILGESDTDFSLLAKDNKSFQQLLSPSKQDLRPLEHAALIKKACNELFGLYCQHSFRPLVLKIDNIDFANEEFLLELRSLLNYSKSYKLKLIATCQEASSMVVKLFGNRPSFCKTTTLQHLSDNSVKTLIDQLCESNSVELSAENINWIVLRSNGIPENAIQCFEYLRNTNFTKPKPSVSLAVMLKEQVNNFNGIERQVLATIALYKPRITQEELSHLFETFEDSVDSCLSKAIEKGIIRRQKSEFIFTNSRVRSACSNLCGGYYTKAIHFKLAKYLLGKCEDSFDETNIFELADHMLAAKDYDVDTFNEGLQLKILESAARNAFDRSEFTLSYLYMLKALPLINNHTDVVDENSAVNLLLIGQKASYLTNNMEQMDECTFELLQRVNDSDIRVEAVGNAVEGYLSKNQISKAVKLAISGLNELGVQLKTKPGMLETSYAIFKAWYKLSSKNPQASLNLFECEDKTQNNIARLLLKVVISTYGSQQRLFAMACCLIIDSTFKHGVSSESYSIFQVFFSSIVAGYLKKINKGRELSSKWEEYVTTEAGRVNIPRAEFIYNAFIDYHNQELSENVQRLDNNFHQNIEVGAFDIAAYTAHVSAFHSLDGFEKVPDIAKRIDSYLESLGNITQQNADRWLSILRQAIADLLEPNTHSKLIGRYFNIEKDLDASVYETDRAAVFIAHHYSVVKAILFDKISLAYKASLVSDKYRPSVAGTYGEYLSYFVNSIVSAKLAFLDSYYKSNAIKKIKKSIRALRKACDQTSVNLEHKLEVLELVLDLLKGGSRKTLDDLADLADSISLNGYFFDALITYEIIHDFKPSSESMHFLYKAKEIASTWGAQQVEARIEEKILSSGSQYSEAVLKTSSHTIYNQLTNYVNKVNASSFSVDELVEFTLDIFRRLTGSDARWIPEDDELFPRLRECFSGINTLERSDSIQINESDIGMAQILPVQKSRRDVAFFLLPSFKTENSPIIKNVLNAINHSFTAQYNLRYAEDQLRDLEHTYDNLFATSWDGVAIANQDGTILKANRRLIELFELGDRLLTNDNIYSIIFNLSPLNVKSNLLQAFQDSEVEKFQQIFSFPTSSKGLEVSLYQSNVGYQKRVFCHVKQLELGAASPEEEKVKKLKRAIASKPNVERLKSNKSKSQRTVITTPQADYDASATIYMLENAITGKDRVSTISTLKTLQRHAFKSQLQGLNHMIQRFLDEVDNDAIKPDWNKFQYEYLPVFVEIYNQTKQSV